MAPLWSFVFAFLLWFAIMGVVRLLLFAEGRGARADRSDAVGEEPATQLIEDGRRGGIPLTVGRGPNPRSDTPGSRPDNPVLT